MAASIKKSKPVVQKPIYKVDTPYATPKWPAVTRAEHDILLEMLCSVLSPIGQHRIALAPPSKGKRARRKRRRTKSADMTTANAALPLPRQPPLISSAVKVGFNSVTRCIERAATRRLPECLGNDKSDLPISDEPPVELAVVFLSKADDDLLYAHLPALCATASARRSKQTAIRIINLDASAETQLAGALQLPRVGVVGIPEDCPNAAPLVEYVRAHVECVEIPWLTEALSGQYQPLKIEVTVPSITKFADVEKTLK